MKNEKTEKEEHSNRDQASASKQEAGSRKPEDCETCDEYLTGWKRALADYDNLKKQLDEERTRARANVKEDVLVRVIPLLDNFQEAIRHAPQEESVQGWLQGVSYVRHQLETVLMEMGAVQIGKVGEIFNPNEHEAVGSTPPEPQSGEEDKEIIKEIKQIGWKLGDKVIRPAKVIIQ